MDDQLNKHVGQLKYSETLHQLRQEKHSHAHTQCKKKKKKERKKKQILLLSLGGHAHLAEPGCLCTKQAL